MNQGQRGDDEGSNGGEGTGKSERKRQREKDRRKEMAEGFVELGHLLAQVDPDDESSSGKRTRRSSEDVGSGDADSSGMTRIDLISRAIDTIRRLHNENLELKRRKGGVAEKEVLVMVPTLQPSTSPRGSSQGTTGSPSAAPPPQFSSNPYYPPQPAGRAVAPPIFNAFAPQGQQQPIVAPSHQPSNPYVYPPAAVTTPGAYAGPPNLAFSPANAPSRPETQTHSPGGGAPPHIMVHGYQQFGMYPASYTPPQTQPQAHQPQVQTTAQQQQPTGTGDGQPGASHGGAPSA